ncbi:MAG: ABC transporter ATP-binding protein [Gammaproteobacteria bacterium]
MKTLLTYLMVFPRRSFFMLLALIIAGIVEGLSLTTLLPLLSAAVGETDGSGVGRFIIDFLENAGIDPTIAVMLMIIVGGMIIKSLILLIANRQVGYTVAHVATTLRLDLIKALLASRWEYYLRQPAGSLVNSIATEAYRAANGFEYGANFIALIFQVIVYSIVALLISWQATLACLAITVILFTALHGLVNAARLAGARQTRLLRQLLSYLSDVLGSVKSLKAMARENVADDVLRDQTRQLEKALRKEVMSRESLYALQEPIIAILAATGLYLALEIWQLSLPEVMVLIFLLARILGQVNKAQRRFQLLTTQESAYWALRSAAEEAHRSAERIHGSVVPTLTESIQLRNVCFAYGTQTVFENLNLEIPAQSFVAVTGPSGAGKSTLLDILCGLVEPQKGEILIDGVSIHDIDLRLWRRMIGYVSQDTILLHDTIFTNVVVGEKDLTGEDAERALKEAGAWSFIESLPEGMNTVVGERGGQLSGGQRQRIAIARALAHRPRFLILDEPTSALDPDSERLICETLKKLTGDLTVIAVSHQPALINAADRIYIISECSARETCKKSLPEVDMGLMI